MSMSAAGAGGSYAKRAAVNHRDGGRPLCSDGVRGVGRHDVLSVAGGGHQSGAQRTSRGHHRCHQIDGCEDAGVVVVYRAVGYFALARGSDGAGMREQEGPKGLARQRYQPSNAGVLERGGSDRRAAPMTRPRRPGNLLNEVALLPSVAVGFSSHAGGEGVMPRVRSRSI
jgi:hypothetical protein